MPAARSAPPRLAAAALALLLALAASPPAARAQGPAAPAGPPAASTGSGPEYDVYVTEDEEIVEQIGPHRVIERERIRERSARTLDELLRLEPGLYVRSGNEGVPRIDMRGLRSRHVLPLLDGIPISSTEDGQLDPGLIPSESMERVKLGFGNSSVLYGDGPLAGVIQIETRRPEEGVQAELGGDFRSGPQNLGRFSILGRNGALDALVAGSLFDGKGFPLSDDFDASASENGGTRENSDRDRRNLLARAGWTPSETSRIGALVSFVDGDQGLPPNAIGDPTDPFAPRVRYERVEDLSGISGQLSTQWDPSGPLDVRGWAYLNRLDEDRRRYDDDAYDSMDDPRVSGTFRADNESLVAGQALHASWSFGDLGRLKGAFQSRRESFDTKGQIRDVRLGGGRFDVRWFDEDWQQTVYNAGVEYEVALLRDAGVVVGYGHSFLDKDGGESDDGSMMLAGAFWELHPGTRVRASAARKLRFPSLLQLHEPGRGNEDLHSEHSWDYEIGLSQTLPGRTVVDVTGFWLDVDDYIEENEATALFENQDHYRFRGVEVTLETHPFDDLDLRASYTFLDSDNLSSNNDQDGLQNRPRHRMAFESLYRLPWGFAVRGALYWVADQYVYSRQPPVRRRGTGDYFLTELRLAKSLFEDRLGLYVGVENATDEDFQESYGVPGPGRVLFGGLELRY